MLRTLEMLRTLVSKKCGFNSVSERDTDATYSTKHAYTLANILRIKMFSHTHTLKGFAESADIRNNNAR